MKKTVLRMHLIVIAALALIIGSTGLGMAQQSGTATEDVDKQLTIRSTQATQGALDVAFRPVKEVFQVGEPVQFKIKGNRNFFLYLFSIDKENNQGVLLVPTDLHKGNYYGANIEFTVPTYWKVDFVPDSPGVEKIIMLASTKWIPIEQNKFTKSGDFFVGTAADIEQQAKTLRLRAVQDEKSTVTKEIDLVVMGQGEAPKPEPRQPGQPAPAPEVGAIPFVSTDRTAYRVGDQMEILFGADRPGYVYLLVVEPGSRPKLVLKEYVSGTEFKKVQGRANTPIGDHLLVALYDEKGQLDDQNFELVDPANVGKGIVVKGGKPQDASKGEVDKGIDILTPKSLPQAIHHLQILQ